MAHPWHRSGLEVRKETPSLTIPTPSLLLQFSNPPGLLPSGSRVEDRQAPGPGGSRRPCCPHGLSRLPRSVSAHGAKEMLALFPHPPQADFTGASPPRGVGGGVGGRWAAQARSCGWGCGVTSTSWPALVLGARRWHLGHTHALPPTQSSQGPSGRLGGWESRGGSLWLAFRPHHPSGPADSSGGGREARGAERVRGRAAEGRREGRGRARLGRHRCRRRRRVQGPGVRWGRWGAGWAGGGGKGLRNLARPGPKWVILAALPLSRRKDFNR